MIRQRFPLILICLTFLVLFPFVTHSQIHISGEISGTLVDTTYIVDDDITLAGALHIEPGARLLFEQGTHFTANRLLVADGEPGDSIYFELNDGANAWHGIDITYNSSYGHYLNYCVITGSISSGIDASEGAALHLFNSRISGNTSEEVGGGVRFRCLSGAIDSCLFVDNENYALSANYFLDSTMFSHLEIVRNDGGIHIDFEGGNVHFSNCKIYENYRDGDGAGVCTYTRTAFYNSLFYNNICSNRGGAIYSFYVIELYNCTIVNNHADYRGSAIFGYASNNPTIVNTIVALNSGNNAIDFLSRELGLNYDIHNSCFYSPDSSVIHPHPYDSLFAVIDRTNANGDSCDIFNNIYLDPGFVNDTLDYHLSMFSPCIDAGSPDSPLDPDNTISDIGVYYYDQTFVSEHRDYSCPTNFEVSPAYPNPFNATTSVLVETPFRSPLTIRVFDILGRLVYSRNNHTVSAGQHLYQISGAAWGAGTYFVQIEAGAEKEVQKIILLK